jgi:hypothetical protein
VDLPDPVYGLTWRPLGLFPLAPKKDHWVELEASATYETLADAIAVPDAIKLEATGVGTTPVSMNQIQNGGTWNLLGTFILDSTLNPKVELSDQANGVIVTDAVLLVPAGISSDRVTHTPTLPSAGMVDIYAKWNESSTRAETVKYTIHHGEESTDID